MGITTITQRKGWTVVIYRKDGSRFCASMPRGEGPGFWYRRKAASVYAKEMREHGFDAVVQRITMTLEIAK